MEHLYKYLQSHKEEDLLDCNSIEVSLKVDGTPLQMEITDNTGKNVKFHSRGSDMTKPGPELTSLDLFMNPAFFNQVNTLRKAIEEEDASSVIQYANLLNFEIIIDNDHHIIHYKSPLGNMYLLNGTTKNDKPIGPVGLRLISSKLGVTNIPCRIFNGSDTMKKLVDFSKETSLDDNTWRNRLEGIIGKGLVDEEMEGIVIMISGGKKDGSMLKIDSPKFVNTFNERKDTKMSEDDEKEIKSILDLAISLIDEKALDKWSNDPLENMILNFNKTIASSQESLKKFVDKCQGSSKSRKNAVKDAIPDKYKTNGDDWVLGLQNFIWLFRKQRKGLLKNANEIAKIIASGKQ